jgi:hypothetical protein
MPTEDTTTGATGNDTVTGGSTTTTTTTPPTPTPLTEQQKADRLAVTLLKTKIRNGIALSDDEVVFYMIGDSVVAQTAMQSMDNGGGYDELKTIGLTETQVLDVLSIYNVKIAPSKYESELGIDAIDNNKLLLANFLTYLQTNNVEFPSFIALYSAIRSKPAIYAAMREWNKTRAV